MPSTTPYSSTNSAQAFSTWGTGGAQGRGRRQKVWASEKWTHQGRRFGEIGAKPVERNLMRKIRAGRQLPPAEPSAASAPRGQSGSADAPHPRDGARCLSRLPVPLRKLCLWS